LKQLVLPQEPTWIIVIAVKDLSLRTDSSTSAMQLLAQMIGPDLVLRLPFLIGKPQSRRKSQVAGLLSLAGKSFVRRIAKNGFCTSLNSSHGKPTVAKTRIVSVLDSDSFVNQFSSSTAARDT
jgi:hypothetical protein